MQSLLFQASVVILFAAALPATLFPILYAKFFPWYKNPLGRALFTKAAGLCLLIDVSVLYAIFGDDYPFRDFVRFAVFLIVCAGLYYQCIVIIKIKIQSTRLQRERMQDKDNEELGRQD